MATIPEVGLLLRIKECGECRGTLTYKGLGEYVCEKCGLVQWDDYGKVRKYLEDHRRATVADVAMATGVKQRIVNELIREQRIEIARNSRVFLRCEKCGEDIREGRYCVKCAGQLSRIIEGEDKAAAQKRKKMEVFGAAEQGQNGAKRFRRED